MPTKRLAEYIECEEHPFHPYAMRPMNGCVVCMGNFTKLNMRSRQKMVKNGSTMPGMPFYGKGICRVCGREDIRLSSVPLVDGKGICAFDVKRFEDADRKASSRGWIRKDMEEYGVPLVGNGNYGFGGLN